VSPTHGEQEMSVWNGHSACNLPDGRGRHPTANVPGDFAADRGTATRSAPLPPFGLAALPVTVGTSRLSCRKAEIGGSSRQFGSHLGNPG
jgi:hypothetical protein